MFADIRGMVREFQDRNGILFGREEDLAYLLTRSERQGLTAIVGRPQMGKSWLLTELSRRLSEPLQPPQSASAQSPLSARPSYLVGFAESFGETADLMLRAVADLYSRWLSDSNYFQQAQVVFHQQREDLIGRAGETVGRIVERISKIGDRRLEAIGTLVREGFEGLAEANREFISGGIRLPRLQVEQSRDLLDMLSRVTNCRSILVFDQWEKSPGNEMERSILDSFLRHCEDWPPCHIFLGVRAEEAVPGAIDLLAEEFPGVVRIHPLGEMHLDRDSSARLLEYVRRVTPAARDATDAELLELIAGYPGVVARWTSSLYKAEEIRTLGELRTAAQNAFTYRFPEFAELLSQLDEGQRQLCMKLALLPPIGDLNDWNALKRVVMQDLLAANLDALKRNCVLESTSPPSFGHAKRADAALQWLIGNCYEELREVCESLIVKIGSQIQGVGPQDTSFASAVAALSPIASMLRLSTGTRALCVAARSLFGTPYIDFERLIGAGPALDGTDRAAVRLLGIGLFNALNQAGLDGANERRDALLEELRELSRTCPEEPAVRELLARGLYNTLIDAKREGQAAQCYALLDELRELAQTHQQESVLRAWLASGLVNTANLAGRESAPKRRDALLEELRRLADARPEEEELRDSLAKGLFNALVQAKDGGKLKRRNALLRELRELHTQNPEATPVREELAKGLFNTLFDAKEEGQLARRDGLLEELRALASDHPEDAAVREWLARALLKAQEVAEHSDAMLEELRELAQTHQQDAAVRERLAKALFNAVCSVSETEEKERCDLLLEELRELAHKHPQETAVGLQLAKGLGRVFFFTVPERDRHRALLNELCEVIDKHPLNSTFDEIRMLIEVLGPALKLPCDQVPKLGSGN